MSNGNGATLLGPRTVEELRSRLATTAFAFRGYNVTNTGLTAELLDDPRYAAIVERNLRRAQEACVGVTGRPVDLVAMARERRPASLEEYGENIAFVLGAEAAHAEILRDVLEVPLEEAKTSFGYSLGEVAALNAAGTFSLETATAILVELAADTADLAHDTTMGILFSRSPALNLDAVRRTCVELTSRGEGTIAISSILSPNTVLLLGQGDTVERFKQTARDVFVDKVHLKVNEHRWPPVHTPIVWQRAVPNRAGVLLGKAPGGFGTPKPPVLSCVTGDFAYGEWNAREILTKWVDHPQRLWNVIERVLDGGVQTVVHMGPEPNIVPATFLRLANNVAAQLAAPTWSGFGMRTVSRFANRSWIGRLMTREAFLLRAPTVRHVTFEQWLLELPRE